MTTITERIVDCRSIEAARELNTSKVISGRIPCYYAWLLSGRSEESFTPKCLLTVFPRMEGDYELRSLFWAGERRPLDAYLRRLLGLRVETRLMGMDYHFLDSRPKTLGWEETSTVLPQEIPAAVIIFGEPKEDGREPVLLWSLSVFLPSDAFRGMRNLARLTLDSLN